MSKRRISKGSASAIGRERVASLTAMSLEAARAGEADRARRYVDLSLRICMKTRSGMPEGFRYCKGCLAPLVPGVNCSVRLTGGKIVSACGCGRVWRMPYIKERKV
ncbi:MAG: ribonuclease P protein component 4 [Candidatus Methanoplasma sp.]|jgi:ribonuclease P protein subunit RPR2|nr:ribonuclease P protein component 4 [Candidatus Methanoplasma sp.]